MVHGYKKLRQIQYCGYYIITHNLLPYCYKLDYSRCRTIELTSSTSFLHKLFQIWTVTCWDDLPGQMGQLVYDVSQDIFATKMFQLTFPVKEFQYQSEWQFQGRWTGIKIIIFDSRIDIFWQSGFVWDQLI